MRVMKKVSKINRWIGPEQFVLLQSKMVIGPGIYHLREIAIIPSHPAIKYASQHLYQKKYYYLGMTEAGMGEKFDFCNQPGKQNKIKHKKKVLQTGLVLASQ